MTPVASTVWNNQHRPPVSRRNRWWNVVVIAGGVACLVATIGVSGVLGDATTRPAKKPTATTVAWSGPTIGTRAAFTAMVIANTKTLNADARTIAHTCNPISTAKTCRDAYDALDGDIHSFLDALDASHPPVCLADAAATLRRALQLYNGGLRNINDGLDASRPALVRTGKQGVAQGETTFAQGVRQMNAAVC